MPNTDPEKRAEYQRNYMKTYNRPQRDLEKRSAYNKQYKLDNKEKCSQLTRDWESPVVLFRTDCIEVLD